MGENYSEESIETPKVVQSRPENYLVWSILVTVLCCWPFGIPAIVYSARVDNLWKTGDVEGANDAAKKAKKFCWISFGIAALCWLLYFGFMAFALFMA